jgi:hypothetical protein
MKCAACSEEIQDDALKCRHCGTILIPSDWQLFCQSYTNMDEAQRARAWKQLSAEQQEALSRFMTVVQPSAASAPVVQPRKRASYTSVGCAVVLVLFLIGLVTSQVNKSDSSKTVSTTSSPAAPAPPPRPTPGVEETIRIVSVDKVRDLMKSTPWPGATVSGEGVGHTNLVIMDASMTAADCIQFGRYLEARMGKVMGQRGWQRISVMNGKDGEGGYWDLRPKSEIAREKRAKEAIQRRDKLAKLVAGMPDHVIEMVAEGRDNQTVRLRGPGANALMVSLVDSKSNTIQVTEALKRLGFTRLVFEFNGREYIGNLITGKPETPVGGRPIRP